MKVGKILALTFAMLSTSIFGQTAPVTTAAKVYEIKPGPGNKVEWTASGTPGFIKIQGTGGQLTGKATDSGGTVEGEFTVDLAAYKTGLELRDKHMNEKYLETAKYPKAWLKLNPVKYSATEFEWTGELKLKDITKPVKGKATVVGDAQKILMASFKVAITDYPSIGVPSYLGITVAKEVEVNIEAPF